MIPLRDDQPISRRLRELFSDRAEPDGVPVGAFVEPPGAEWLHVRVWRGASPHAGGARPDIRMMRRSTAILPLFTSMFLHASFLHVAGNMLFLWIFGDNVEDYLGHFTYLVFYFVSGAGGRRHAHSAEPGLAHAQRGRQRRDCRE